MTKKTLMQHGDSFRVLPPGVIPLRPGVETPSPSPEEEQERINSLRVTVEYWLPEFVKAVKGKDADKIVLHQDAFASSYDKDEYTLFGMAVKYAGLHGKELHIIGANHETF